MMKNYRIFPIIIFMKAVYRLYKSSKISICCLLIFLCAIVLTACNNKHTDNPTSLIDTAKKVQVSPAKVTFLNDLNDSLQPKVSPLINIPKPYHVIITRAKNKVSLSNKIGAKFNYVYNQNSRSNFVNFSTDNGLSLDGVSSSILDRFGNLWFATYGGGANRFDGKSFTVFNTNNGLPSNNIWSIFEDSKGNIWFGSHGLGVSKYDGKEITNFNTKSGLPNNTIRSIKEDKYGNIWFATNGGGISKFDGKTFTNYNSKSGLPNDNVYCIYEDKKGFIWFGTFGDGVCRFDGKSFKNYTTRDGLANNMVLSILEDNKGNLWFGTSGAGVSKFDGNTFENFTTTEGLASNIVWTIFQDKFDNLWFGTSGGGISTYNGKTFVNYNTSNGLANDFITTIIEDRIGNIWIGTNGGGVNKYEGKSFTNFTTEVGLANNTVWSILEDRNGVYWFGCDGSGVSKFDGESFTNINFNTAHVQGNNTVWSITEDKQGSHWFGTYRSGVFKFDGTSFYHFSTDNGLSNNTVFSSLCDKSGNLWFCTDGGGVCKFDGNFFTTYTTVQGLANNHVLSVFQDKSGAIWFGTDGGGVSRFDGQSFINFTTDQGLANNIVTSIFQDKSGNIWFATSEGLSLLTNEVMKNYIPKKDNYKSSITKLINNTQNIFKNYFVEDGLSNNNISNIIQIPNGKIAVGTNLGINIFNVSKDYSKLIDLEIYNTNTGFPVKDVNSGHNGMYLDSKGAIWAGTGSEKTALVRFDYTALHRNIHSPILVIQSIKIKGESVCWSCMETKDSLLNHQNNSSTSFQEYLAYGRNLNTKERDSVLKRFGNIKFESVNKFYTVPQGLVLPYEHNQISFDFIAIETGKPASIQYQFMLEGYDKSWSPLTTRNIAEYGNIFEGTYTFKLRAIGANGVWSEPINYSFQVLPPWYRTWWAYFLYLVLFFSSLTIFIKWRERNLRIENEKLEEKVELRTAEVQEEKKEVERQKKRSDDLLRNILPEEVAEELKAKGSAEAKYFEQVSVMFTDFKGFTQLSEMLSPAELVSEIHTCFKAFDEIISKYNIEKIKTIGDAYMCAGGLPIPNNTNARDILRAAIEILQFMQKHNSQRVQENKIPLDIRIGVHTGAVVAGIVGLKKFAYDIWGDTVNIASRMESSGEPGKINISGVTYDLVKDEFKCNYRGKIQAKNKGEIDMYFVEY